MGLKATKYSVGPRTYSPEWRALRTLEEGRSPEVCYGASEAGVICGLDRYKTRLALYLEKRGLVDEWAGSEAADWGKLLEPSILAE